MSRYLNGVSRVLKRTGAFRKNDRVFWDCDPSFPSVVTVVEADAPNRGRDKWRQQLIHLCLVSCDFELSEDVPRNGKGASIRLFAGVASFPSTVLVTDDFHDVSSISG